MRGADDTVVVAILAVPRAYPLDVAIPAHVFGQHPRYAVAVAGDDPDDLRAGIRPTRTLDEAADADVLVIPGYEDPDVPLPRPYLDAVASAHARGARVVALCTGVFALADLGLLDGRRVTTHWSHAALLRERCPGADLVDRLLVEDGELLTAAGAAAGIDACLHVVASDLGAGSAGDVARHVVSPVRAASEPQDPHADRPGRADLRGTREWVLADLAAAVTVDGMAGHSHLARRTFIRRFEQETGMPPMRWVAWQRLLRARRLLEESDWTVERIASATGFGTAANLRAVFRREVGATPSGYRRLRATDGAYAVG